MSAATEGNKERIPHHMAVMHTRYRNVREDAEDMPLLMAWMR